MFQRQFQSKAYLFLNLVISSFLETILSSVPKECNFGVLYLKCYIIPVTKQRRIFTSPAVKLSSTWALGWRKFGAFAPGMVWL